jgi:glycine cleavage system protein P-like pyridoxal-binding family
MKTTSNTTESRDNPSLAGLAMIPLGSCSMKIAEMTSCAKERNEPVRSCHLSDAFVNCARQLTRRMTQIARPSALSSR